LISPFLFTYQKVKAIPKNTTTAQGRRRVIEQGLLSVSATTQRNKRHSSCSLTLSMA
jgi:hypothetical protein